MTSTLIKYNVILIVLCIGITLIHNSSEAIVKKDVILYYNHLSPQCRSVLLTLGAFDLEITLIPIDLLNGEQLPEKLREINSLHTVPVLEDGDFVLSESNAIIVYLVQQYGGSDHSLYPKDLKIQAQTAVILHGKQKTIEEEADAKMHNALKYFEEILKKSTWAVGESMTLADFALLASISTLEAIGFDLKEYEKIQEWLSKCRTTGKFEYDRTNQLGIDDIKSLLERVKMDKDKIDTEIVKTYLNVILT